MPDERVCLFGGTFDPVHLAHLKMAEHAVRKFHLDRVLFIPAGNPPHKSAVASYEDRLAMLQLACAGKPSFQASDIERGGGRSYTVDTLEKFRRQIAAEDRLFFLIGADAFSELETWRRWEDVVRMADFIVVSRPGASYRVPPGAIVHRLEDVRLPTASTTIRAKLAAGKTVPEVPAVVREYIAHHGLYATSLKQ